MYDTIPVTAITDGNWHHVAVVRASSEVRVYVDGKFEGKWTGAPTGALTIDPNGLWIGGDQDCVGGCWETRQQFNGILDEVRILNRSLTPEEIKQDYKMTKTVFLTTDKPSYNLGETVRLSIGLNYSRDRPPIYASFKLELVEPTGTPDVLIQTPIFSLTPGFNITKTINYPIPSTIWIPDGEYQFKGTLNDSLGTIIDISRVQFYLNDSMKVRNEINFI